MEKCCKNCRNHTWGDNWWDCPPVCIKCEYIVNKGGKVPSKWKPMPMTNADRIRAMTDEELATELLPLFEELCEDGIPSPEYMRFWLKQPAKEGSDEG